MKSPAEIGTAGAVGELGVIARTIVYSVLISAGVLLLKMWWGRPEVAITLLLALLLAKAGGRALMRLLAAKKRKTLATLWQSLLLSAVGLLLVLLGRNDWLMMLPGIVISGIGLGSASQVTTALLQPLANISVVASVASFAVIGGIVSVTLLIQSPAPANFAMALLVDLLLLGALVARIAEREAA